MQNTQKRPIIVFIASRRNKFRILSGKSSMAKGPLWAKTSRYHYVDTRSNVIAQSTLCHAQRLGIDNNGTPDSKAIADAMPLLICFILMPDGSPVTPL